MENVIEKISSFLENEDMIEIVIVDGVVTVNNNSDEEKELKENEILREILQEISNKHHLPNGYFSVYYFDEEEPRFQIIGFDETDGFEEFTSSEGFDSIYNLVTNEFVIIDEEDE